MTEHKPYNQDEFPIITDQEWEDMLDSICIEAAGISREEMKATLDLKTLSYIFPRENGE